MATKEWFPLDSKGFPMKTEIMEVESEEDRDFIKNKLKVV